VNPNLIDWASSLSGCDGGNINAKTWLCGIEWGGGSRDAYYEKDLPEEIKAGQAQCNTEVFHWKESITYNFGWSFAKLYTAMNGGKVEDYRQVADLSGKELFKLNLYPIAFDSTDHSLWHKHGLDEITGFENKYLFNTWCFFNRFPAFTKLRKKQKPELIICTGVDYLRDFLMFCGGDGAIEKLNVGKIAPASANNRNDRTYYWVVLDGETLLVIIPFFSGSYGLNSNYLLQQFGEQIAHLRNEMLSQKEA